MFVRTGDDTDALAWVGEGAGSVTESQYTILKAAECNALTPAVSRAENHHELVAQGVTLIASEERAGGRPVGAAVRARFKTYERLKRYAAGVARTLFDTAELTRAIDEIYRFPLTQTAKDLLNMHLKADISDEMLADAVMMLRRDNRLCVVTEDGQGREPRIVCSLGLRPE